MSPLWRFWRFTSLSNFHKILFSPLFSLIFYLQMFYLMLVDVWFSHRSSFILSLTIIFNIFWDLKSIHSVNSSRLWLQCVVTIPHQTAVSISFTWFYVWLTIRFRFLMWNCLKEFHYTLTHNFHFFLLLNDYYFFLNFFLHFSICI